MQRSTGILGVHPCSILRHLRRAGVSWQTPVASPFAISFSYSCTVRNSLDVHGSSFHCVSPSNAKHLPLSAVFDYAVYHNARGTKACTLDGWAGPPALRASYRIRRWSTRDGRSRNLLERRKNPPKKHIVSQFNRETLRKHLSSGTE